MSAGRSASADVTAFAISAGVAFWFVSSRRALESATQAANSLDTRSRNTLSFVSKYSQRTRHVPVPGSRRRACSNTPAAWMHALTVGLSQMTPQGEHVAALVEQDPALAVFRLDLRTELEAALTVLFTPQMHTDHRNRFSGDSWHQLPSRSRRGSDG
jgi:hypothetical protein